MPGLAHSSPIVWGNRIFVTTAISSKPDATFKPGLYGAGTASEDRSRHTWAILCFDKASGKLLWQRDAFVGEPREKRHIKSTYASATPATDGRIVVASFGSQGLHAYDVTGKFLWKVDLGRMDVGAYDIPSYEWGTASSPIIWNDLVIQQVDTQVDSFLIALNATTGETVWKTDRDELPSWGSADGGADERRSDPGDERVELHARLRSAHRARNCGGSAAARRSRRRRQSSPTICSSSPAAALRSGRSSWYAQMRRAPSR